MPAFDGFLQDLRYAFRTLRRDAAFTAFAILIAGLGVGASATVFSVVNTLLLRPLPFSDPQRLVWIANHDVAGMSGQTTQVGHMLDLRAQNHSLEGIAGYFAFYGVGDNLLSGRGEPERLTSVPVSENFFQLLGVKPMLGRLFTAEESKWHGPGAALLSYGLWKRRFASDPSIVGTTLRIDDQPVVVAGVLPASFDMATVFAPGSHFDLYVPFPLSPETNRWGNTMAMIGRLKPGVTPAAAQAEITILAQQNSKAHPERNNFEGIVTPLAQHVSGRIRPALLVLIGAVTVVMLIVCANLSNMLLARTAGRQKEIAIRTALGAGRGRLIRQMLTEGIALSTCGAILGAALAAGGIRLIASLEALSIPLLAEVRLDPAVLAFCLLAAVFTGVVFGLAPALQAPLGAVHDALKDATRGATAGKSRGWIRSALVVSEIAFACVLLVGASLLIRSFLHVLQVDMGFRPEYAASTRIDPEGRLTGEQTIAYFDDALRRIRSVPGVQAAGLTDSLPLGRNRSWGTPAKGQTYAPGHFPSSYIRIVTDGYRQAMGIRLVAGRDLSDRDRPGSDAAIAVNETFARTLFPGQNPLGQVIRACGERHIVGVFADVHHLALEENSGMEVYIPMRQCSDRSMTGLVVRSSLPPADLAAGVRAALKPILPNFPANDFRMLQQLVDRSVSPRRFTAVLLGSFAVFALLLASLGIYGVVSYGVTQRTQEIGIRMALGASASRLQAGIVGRTLGLAAIGMAIGTAASIVLARSLSGLLFGVTVTDPLTFLSMPAVLALVAAIAGFLPARRASRIDPSIALRAS
jgi:predicted permease